MYKKGGSGHKYSNWQKRFFVLQGTLLCYYEGSVKNLNGVKGLKGTIEVATLSDIISDESILPNPGKKNYFQVIVDNERDFFFSTSSPGEKETWVNSLIDCRQAIANKFGRWGIELKEKVLEVGLPALKQQGKYKKVCMCITNTSLRFYKQSRILDFIEDWDFINGQLGSISLVGTYLQLRTDQHGMKYIIIMDVNGGKYYIKGKEADLVKWHGEITKHSRSLLLAILDSGSDVRLNAFATPSDVSADLQGHVLITINSEILEFRFLLTGHVFRFPLGSIVNVTGEDNTFSLSWIEDEDEKIIRFQSENAFGLSDTIGYSLNTPSESPQIRNRGESVWIRSDADDDNQGGPSMQTEMPEFNPQKDSVDLDDFDLLSVIGRGAFGKVLLCRLSDDPNPNNVFAMKCILKKSLVRHEKEIEHTLAERSVMMKLNHPFLMKLHYTFQTEDKLFYIMDYINGGELFYHLQNDGKFSLERTKFYIAELLCALDALHQQGIVYRDIKTENILLGPDGHVVLTDFGLSKELEDDSTTQTLCGTPVYLPPEMLKKKAYDKAVDFWSIGILTFEMLTGDVPFYHDNMNQMFRKIVQAEVEYPPELQGTPAADLINHLLIKDPTRRLADASIMKTHPFFEGIDFDALLRKDLPPPWRPNVSSSIDTSNVDEEIRNEAVVFDQAEGGDLTKEEEAMFNGIEFDYVNPNL
eukprot:TRINITY_DN2188_c0_g1_i1.p1 TRINITY_DN2188_c0_g1~~TRINITY_DN2188_c0_g1_i1.p1  ORF type:complete len:698 (-),score=167.40 TRINITY_DN2188_c0_g1_i1:73-2166(-)